MLGFQPSPSALQIAVCRAEVLDQMFEAQANLGATRPRVGICLSRLDALTSKYITFLLPSWGIEPQLDNAEARTRRPQLACV